MNKLLINTLLFLLATLAGSLEVAAARAENYTFGHINSHQGLSSSNVKTIMQDRYGFMWFGTKNGLNRWDGQSIKRFHIYDSELKRGNDNVGALYETPDNKIWVGTDRGVYVYDMVTDSFKFLDLRTSDNIGADDWVQEIGRDKHGDMWILIPSQGVFHLRNGVLELLSNKRGGHDAAFNPCSLTVTSQGEVYAGTTENGVYKYDRSLSRFEHLHHPEVENDNVVIIKEASKNSLIFCTTRGELFELNIPTGRLTKVPFSGGSNCFPRSMICVGNEVWVGTHTGLYIVNRATGTEQFLIESRQNPCGLSHSTIYFLYADRNRNVWIGTMCGGVDYYLRSGFHFDRYVSTSAPSSISSNMVRGMAKDAAGNIYVGTEDAGYNIFNPATGNFTRCGHGKMVLDMQTVGNDVHVGYVRNGVGVINTATHAESRVVKNHPVFGSQPGYSVYSQLLDNRGNHWIGTDKGVYLAEGNSTELNLVKEIGQDWIFDMLQDSRGIIWMASMGNGVWKYNPSSHRYQHYAYDEAFSNGLHSNSVSSIMEDSKGNLWFSTDRGGLSKYDSQADRFITYTLESGLPDNVVYDVLEDKRGNLWFGTNSGLVKFNPTTESCMVFTSDNALLGNQYNYHSAVKTDDGYMYFGSLDGLVAFNPDENRNSENLGELFFTDLTIMGEDEVASNSDILTKSMMFTNYITLPHDYSVVALTLAAPSFKLNNGNLQFSYRLAPGDTTWIPVTGNRITFAKLPPGKYILQVKAHNGTAQIIKNLEIKIRSPWYKTGWCIALYIFIVLGLFGCWVWWYRSNKEKQMREREKIFKLNQEKELYENKVEFFTELAHEIRTPLSLIDAPLQAIEELDLSDSPVKRYLKVMRQNTERLLNLTAQLLDFQKIDSSKFNITFEKVDVVMLVNDILERFEPAMSLHKKKLTTSIPSKSIFADVDPEAVTKILSNLFNNALKYSESAIHVELTANDTSFKVSVTSDGAKISPTDSLKIFEPFFQLDNKADNNGVGIGLPLCRTLAHLQHGEVEVEDNPDRNTNTFILTLPLKQHGVEVEVPEVASQEMSEFILNDEPTRITTAERSYSVLIVEDNEQMRNFLSEQLSTDFIVESACNGVEALEKIKGFNFDLVVTDIMMPKMDGFELCRALKSDLNRSHLPVVFLTAKNDVDSKVKALECGGEAYIEKPFSMKYFRQQIISILENRKHERKAFLKHPFFPIDSMKVNAADKEFMDKVIAIITENIADENFSVESMADVFCMSRSSLLRKIKALFNQSPIELIHTVKLKRGAELIQEGKYRISDVCYMVGINSPSYFSKRFFKQFGVSPKEFEKQCRQNAQEAKTDKPEKS